MSKIYKHPDFIRLRKLAPNAKCSVLTCSDNNCSNNYETNTTQFIKCATEGEWLLNLSCKVFKSKWSICMTCTKFKTKLLNNRMICLHRCSYHNINSKKRKLNKDNIQDNIIVKKGKNCYDKVITDDDDSPNKSCSPNDNSTTIKIYNNSNLNDTIVSKSIPCRDININNIGGHMFNITDFNYAVEFEKNNPGIHPTKITAELFSDYLEYNKSSHSNDMKKSLMSLRPYTWVLGDAITRLFNLWNQLPELTTNGIYLWSPELVHTMAVNGGRSSFKPMVESIRDDHKLHVFVGATEQNGIHWMTGTCAHKSNLC